MSLSASDIKNIRGLQQKKFRKESNRFVVEGIKTVEELLQSGFAVESIYTTTSEHFSDTDVPVVAVSEKELERISGLKTPNRVLAVAEIPQSKSLNWSVPIIVMLDGIRDPGNLGTIIRTSKWFGINTIICSEDCADVWDRKVVQSTMGALFHVNVIYADLEKVMTEAQSNGFKVKGAAMNGTSIYEMGDSEKTVLLIGSESHGIRPDLLERCDQTVTIPNKEGQQRVESLNAAIATSVILSEMTRQR